MKLLKLSSFSTSCGNGGNTFKVKEEATPDESLDQSTRSVSK